MAEFSELLEEYAVLAAYIDEKESELKGIKSARDNAKAALMAKMNELKMTNAKSQAGHAVTLVSGSTASVEDGEAFFNFVVDSGRSDMLTRRASVEAIEQYLEEHHKLPPGIKFTKAVTLRFTRAK